MAYKDVEFWFLISIELFLRQIKLKYKVIRRFPSIFAI